MTTGDKIGVYIGSFNPPHIGHLKVAEYVLDKKLVDKVLLIPTPGYWDKTNLVDVKHRVAMLKYFERDNIIVDNIHNKEPYTYQVLNSLKKDYYNDELYLIIGSDNLEKFHQWKNVEEILKHRIIVLKRGNIIKNKQLKEYDKQFIYCDDFDVPVSSTDIRNSKKDGLLPDIEKYIKNHHLYENN